MLWDVLPSVPIVILIAGTVWRCRYDKFGWTTRSSEIRRLLRAAYAGYASTVAAAVFPVYLADVLDLTDEAATVLAALDGDTIVGTARLRLRPPAVDLPAGAAYVRGVAVQPGREGRGIARALMTSCAERACTAGASTCTPRRS